MEFIVLGDTHIGRLENYLPKDMDWLNISFKPMRQAEKYALDNGIENIVQNGDLYDFMPTQEMQSAVSDFFSETKVNWWINNGNHAVKSPKEHGLVKLIQESKKWIKKVHFFAKPEKVKIEGVPFIFLPWPYEKHSLIRKTSKAIVIAHTERAGFKFDNGRSIKGKTFKLYKHFWFIGHLHTFQESKNCVFTGAAAQLRFGDPRDHYFFHVTVDKKMNVTYKKVLINPGYEFIDIRVDTVDDLPDMSKIDKNQFVRLMNSVNVTVPDSILTNRQIIKHEPYGSKQDLESIKRDSINIDYVGITAQNRQQLILKYIKDGGRLDKKGIKLAKKLIAEEISEIQFEQTGLR